MSSDTTEQFTPNGWDGITQKAWEKFRTTQHNGSRKHRLKAKRENRRNNHKTETAGSSDPTGTPVQK